MKYLRALWRAGLIVPMAVTMGLVQVLIAAPIFNDYTAIPQFMQRRLCRIFNVEVDVHGLRDEKRQAIIVANHLSWLDAPVLGGLFRGAFIGKADIAHWPVIGWLSRCFRMIAIERTSKYLPFAHEKMVRALNEGMTLIVFPEGTTTDGSDVQMFRAGLLKILYNEAVDPQGNPLHVSRDICIQPVAIRVMETNGRDATNDQSARDVYAWYGNQNFISHLWQALVSEGMRVQVTILPTLCPREFENRFDLINTAQRMVRDVVTAGARPSI